VRRPAPWPPCCKKCRPEARHVRTWARRRKGESGLPGRAPPGRFFARSVPWRRSDYRFGVIRCLSRVDEHSPCPAPQILSTCSHQRSSDVHRFECQIYTFFRFTSLRRYTYRNVTEKFASIHHARPRTWNKRTCPATVRRTEDLMSRADRDTTTRHVNTDSQNVQRF
jgi:hypothetical protein